MQKRAFITGNSSGLGRGLSATLLAQGWQVYGCSRRGCDLEDEIRDAACDLTDFGTIPAVLKQLLGDVEGLDLVVLNAGMLGEIRDISETSLDSLKTIMDINVWSNKVILDWLLHSVIPIDQVVCISSGAAVLGNKGWGGYALSKAALNMLCRLYAHEFPGSHLSAIAPGLIETRMMDYLCDEADADKYPALQRLRAARGTGTMLTPAAAAARIIEALPELKRFESGSFIDLREIVAPEEYAELMASRHQSAD